MAKKLLGLEIGNSTIKILEVKKKGVTWEIINAILIPTPSDSIKDGRIVNQDGLSKLIKEMLVHKKIRTKDTCMLIQGTDIITRDVVIEAENEKHIEALLNIKVKEYLPIELSEYQVDYKILQKIELEEKNQYKVLLVAAPNKTVLPAMQLMTRMKLKPHMISIPLDAIGGLFDEQLKLIDVQTKTNLVIDLGAKSTTLSIIDNGIGILNKEITFGLDDINETIMKEFGSKNLAEVEVFKKKYGAIYETEEETTTEQEDYIQYVVNEEEHKNKDYTLETPYKIESEYDISKDYEVENEYSVNKDYEVENEYGISKDYEVENEYGISKDYEVENEYGISKDYEVENEYSVNKDYELGNEYGVNTGYESKNSNSVKPDEKMTRNKTQVDKKYGDEKFYGHYISNIIRPRMERQLITEINRFIQFYYSRGKNPPIQSIYLIGGGSNLKNIEVYLQEALSLPTYKTTQFKAIKAKSSIRFEENSLYFINLLGLVSGV